jgi:hypothetical protein
VVGGFVESNFPQQPIPLQKSQMHKSHFLAIILTSFMLACNFKKATTVTVQNKNAYPLQISLSANNCNVKIDVAASSKTKAMLDWTDIEKRDGAYQLIVNHGAQGVDTFTHGYFTGGALTNYLDLIVEQHEVKVSASE